MPPSPDWSNLRSRSGPTKYFICLEKYADGGDHLYIYLEYAKKIDAIVAYAGFVSRKETKDNVDFLSKLLMTLWSLMILGMRNSQPTVLPVLTLIMLGRHGFCSGCVYSLTILFVTPTTWMTLALSRVRLGS